MKHIISFSGGAASFATAHAVIEKNGKENVLLGFCDTQIEDEDLYRFIVQGAAALYGIETSLRLTVLLANIPPVYDDNRAEYLDDLARAAMEELPHLVWLMDGRDPWGIFKKERYMGNTRIAPCTVFLKGKTFARWLTKAFQPDECVLYFGFDWTEEHRLIDARENWAPYTCEAPLCAPPYLSSSQIFQIIDDYNLELPRLYVMGFVHNNCGGFCVKAGQAHFENLLRKLPEVYAYHEAKQEQLMIDVPTARPFLRKTINKKLHYLTLRQFREHLQSGGDWDKFEYGGCGCFSDASAGGLAALATNENEQDVSSVA